MIARIRSVSLAPWGRPLLVFALVGLPLGVSCTKSEDTEPFVPAVEGARQPGGEGALVSEDEACDMLRSAALAAYKDLGCEKPTLDACPGFLRPAGGTGCYEYSSESVEACVDAYQSAPTCHELSPCFATAIRNDELPTCELLSGGGGAGAAGAGSGGALGVGGEPAMMGGAPGAGGTPDPGSSGAPQGGAAMGGAGGVTG